MHKRAPDPSKARPEELFAKAIISRELELSVEINDDQSRDGMYDLRVGQPESPEMAIECTVAANSRALETWNIGPAQSPFFLAHPHTWAVGIAENCRIKSLRVQLETILIYFYEAGYRNFTSADWLLEKHDPVTFSMLDKAGITSIDYLAASSVGKAYLTMDGDGGIVDESGHHISEWVASFLKDSKRKDNLTKLEKSRAKENHIFIPISLGGAPWNVASYFFSSMKGSPRKPELPPPIDCVWLTHGDKGLRWDGSRWLAFSAKIEQ